MLASGEVSTGLIAFTVPADTATQGSLTVQPDAVGEVTYVAVD